MNLAFCFALFLGLAVITQGQAEDYYIYHDPDGTLVISNKEPPPGSKIIKQLPEPTDREVPQAHEPGKPQRNVETEALQEQVERRHQSARAIRPTFSNMNTHKYGTHLIRFRAERTPDENYWIGKAHIQYNDGRTLRCFEVHGPGGKFNSKEAAEQHILSLAKTLIDKFI